MDDKIVIIEDEEDILILLSNLLKGEGYTIFTASNGKEGLEIIGQKNPDIIITDVRMPVLDGIEVLKQVKKRNINAEVIILTGHSDEATAIDCLRLGAYDYFRKPLEDVNVLLAAIDRVIEKRKLERNNKSLIEKLEQLSIKDPLTNLYNYRHLQTCLDEEIDRCNRFCHTFFILMIDLDHFKLINDSFGHLYGDYVLVEIANLIKREFRSTDRIFRYGGDEFLVIMNEISKSEVHRAVNRLMTAIRNYVFEFSDKQTAITVSMGGALYPLDAKDKTGLMRKADQELYKAKRNGRDCFECTFSDQLYAIDQKCSGARNC